MKKFLAKFKKDEKGQGLVEYVLIIVLVSVMLVVALVALRGGISTGFDQARSAIVGGT